MVRLSIVDNMKITNILSSSLTQIGDSQKVHLKSQSLAVQKEYSDFKGTEGSFSPFPLFKKAIPRQEVTERVQLVRHDSVPVIKVGTIRMISVAASSIVHIGSTQTIEAESRIKHFRHYAHVPKGFRTRPELTIQTPVESE